MKIKELFSPHDMTVGPPWQRLMEFSVPMLIGNLAQQLYNTADSIVVGHYVGDNALAAVGSAAPILNLLLALFVGISTGAGIVISQNFGAGDRKKLSESIGNCITLAAIAFALILLISLPLGLLAARRPGGVADRAITVLTQLTMSVPNFVMGIALMYLFALVLRWFQPEYIPPEQGLWPHLRFMAFPALAVALPKSAMTVKLLRGSILGELGQDYIRTAYSKGNSRGSALRRHVLRNAMIPVVTFLAMAIGDIMAGSIVVEQVFGVPGLGRVLISSINNRDYPVVQAIVVLLAGAVVGCNCLADLLYRVMDPRIDGR